MGSGIVELYNINNKKIPRIFERLEGYWKFYSIALLRHFDFPTLNGILIFDPCKKVKHEIDKYMFKNGFSSLLIRHDKRDEKPSYPKGGYIVDKDELCSEIDRYIKMNRIVLLLEPADPLNDLYSVNAYFNKNKENIILEIVGPGFDASDLQRGNISPHEIYEINKYDLYDISNKYNFLRKKIVGEKEYKRSVEVRLRKIWKFLVKRSLIEDEEYSTYKAVDYLVKNNFYLFLNNMDTYKPISIKYLNIVAEYLKRVPIEFFKGQDEFVLSMSFLYPSNRIVFWDIVWPKLKYKIA